MASKTLWGCIGAAVVAVAATAAWVLLSDDSSAPATEPEQTPKPEEPAPTPTPENGWR